jgi:hypothetical protein
MAVTFCSQGTPACHAGGRGLESRRSRKVPANRPRLVPGQAQTAAGFFASRAYPALESPPRAGRIWRSPQPGRLAQGAGGRLARRTARCSLATFGFSDEANLDEGAMWPTSFALKELTAAEEGKIGALVKKAVS